MIETALAPYKVGINGITIPILIPLLRCFFVARCALYDEKKSFPGFLRGKDFLCFYPNGRKAWPGIPDLRNFDSSKFEILRRSIMEFNYGLERKRFDGEWERLRKSYHEAGMSEEAIEEMYEFDFKEFNRRRAAAKWEQPFTADITGKNEDASTLFYKFMEPLSHTDVYCTGAPRYSWIEQVTNEALYMRLSQLPDQDKELLTLLAIDGFTQEEAGVFLGKRQSAICKRVKRLGKFLFSTQGGENHES